MSTTVLACNVILDNQRGELRDEPATVPASRADSTQPDLDGGAPLAEGGAGLADALGPPGDGPSRGGRCGAGTKLCGAICVSLREPAYGCADPSCAPCAPPHAYAGCGDAGRCTLGACAPGFADCNGVESDGCEADLSRTLTCGACDVTCPSRPHAAPACSGGACALTCEDGFGDCDGAALDGCEADLMNDADNCGACGWRCKGNRRCLAGTCRTR